MHGDNTCGVSYSFMNGLFTSLLRNFAFMRTKYLVFLSTEVNEFKPVKNTHTVVVV